jgi:hypothetical protein
MRVKAVLAASLCAVAALGATIMSSPPAQAAATRTLVSDYQTTFTGDVAGVLCTETETARGAGWGNVCFPVHSGEQHVAVAIADTRMKTVGARYEFGVRGDTATAVLARGALCDTANLDVPAGANEFRIYFGVVNSGATGACATPSPGVEGIVTATFS